MIGQLFYKKKLILSINTICTKYLKKSINNKCNFLIANCDKYNLITKHFIYLLRLNKLEEKKYKDHIILLKLIIIYYHSQFIASKSRVANFDISLIKKAIEDLTVQLNLQLHNHNIEQDKLTLVSQTVEYNNYHTFYCQIANVFYNIKFQDKAYYDYGYYLTMLFNFQVIKAANSNGCNLQFYQAKLTIVDECILAISKIDAVQFNNFVRNYNKTLRRINKK